jgi:hypothetical protein
MRNFGSAGLDKKLCESGGVALGELLLSKASKPRCTIGEQGLPFPNGEPVPIHMPILFPRARGGEPCVAREDVRRDAESGGTDGEVNNGPTETFAAHTSAIILRAPAKQFCGGERGARQSGRTQHSSMRAATDTAGR